MAAGLASLLALAAFSMPVHADTKADLAAAKKKLATLIDKISAEQDTVASLEADASVVAARYDRVQSQVAETQAAIADLLQTIRLADTHLQGVRDLLDHRAWVAYENGPASNLEFLLGATSLADLTDRMEIVGHAADSDQQLIDQILQQQAILQTKTKDLQKLQAQLGARLKDLQTQKKELNDKITAAQAVVDQLDKDKADANALVEKLKKKLAAEEAAAAAAALAAAEAAKNQGGASSISGVLLCFPVRGAVARSDDFGAPRYSGGYHPHAGNDLFAARGTPIVAPFDGIAADDTNPLGGLSVTVTGSLGYVYNAHLDSIIKLGPVSKGDVIGTVGDSGDARGGPTHDHFEWHPNVIPSHLWVSPYGVSIVGTAIDPYPYLNGAPSC